MTFTLTTPGRSISPDGPLVLPPNPSHMQWLTFVRGEAVAGRSCWWICQRFWWTEGKCFGVGSLDVECSTGEQKRLTERRAVATCLHFCCLGCKGAGGCGREMNKKKNAAVETDNAGP